MIFLSHTHADKLHVDPIAQRLAAAFGENNIFYDSWSIQPGDGVVDKMSEALARCRFFFFFVSKKSLTSNMVKLEWQNAVLKSTKGETRIIPVKLDDCLMPPILLQTLYIDFFNQGPENALRQMVDVISERNTYIPGPQGGFQNVRGYVYRGSETVTIEFRAEAYMEPHSRYMLLLDNTEDEILWHAPEESMVQTNFHTDLQLTGGQDPGRRVNALFMARETATSPGFPFIVKLTPKNAAEVKLVGLMRAMSRNQFGEIPMIES